MAAGPPLAFAAPLGAHVLSGTEVVLLSERDRFALNGPVHAALAPLLDGTRTADELVAALAGTHPPAHVHLALLRLRSQGFVVEAGIEAPPSIVAPAPLPAGTAAPMTTPPLALEEVVAIGVPDEWARRLEEAVRGDDTETVPDDAAPAHSLVVALVDDHLRPELAASAAACLGRGAPLLVVRPVGRWLWLGPLLAGTDARRAWELLGERVRMNRFADVVALERGVTLPLFPDDRSEPTVALALDLAAQVVRETLAGRPRAELHAGLLTFDTVTAELDHHAVARVAPIRSDEAPAFGVSLPPLHLATEHTRFSGDGGHRTVSPAETLARLRPLISPITGLVASIDPVASIGDMHVFTAVHPQSSTVTRPRGRTLGRKGGSMGKGFQREQAMVSCLGEALERYSGGFFGDEPRRRARLADVADVAIGPEELLLYSDAQYAAGWAGEDQAADAVPARFDPEQAIEWVPVRSLIDGATRWVPAAFAYYGYGAAGAERPFCVADSNGCAAGNTVEEAILQGLMELIERDACGIAWYNRARRPGIDLDSFGEPSFSRAKASFATRGRELHVLDLRVDTDVPVAMAVSWNRDDGRATRFALGCHLEPRIAVSRALSELAQLQPDDPDDDAAIAPLFALDTIGEQPYLRPADGPLMTASALPDRTQGDIAAELRWCCDMLAGLGHDVLVLDQTRPEVGFPVVRVIVPGLRHFWRRLAPGRLYDVPVALGWREMPLREDELNPVSVLV